ncbi:hypothetical protein LSH36_840g02019 [Paralvinella palmiformis]|uniref:RING-type domain-containing protein n=1 Tax=Paralvinella palmiformis TaxID=53620 RepID=A0AAD9MTN6_9ANNE|nr:hypothetical protein LSH36_840g02019 [Paralvinella palmiformis]
MEEPLKIRIRDVNPHIVCSLCAGYFIDATTITECLHTFCKSCIVKCLQNSKSCPQCNIKIHETQPLANLKPDRVMQDIIFKLIPGLYEDEERRKQEFFKSRGMIKEKKKESVAPALTSVYDDPHGHYYITADEQLLPMLPRKFIRCSVRTYIHHVVLLLRKKLQIPPNVEVEIFCEGQILDPAICLKQVWIMFWISKPSPMMLYYRGKQMLS